MFYRPTERIPMLQTRDQQLREETKVETIGSHADVRKYKNRIVVMCQEYACPISSRQKDVVMTKI